MHQFCFYIPKKYCLPLKLNISQCLHPMLYYRQIKSQAGLNKMWNRLTKYHVSQCWKRRNWSWKSLKKCYPNITIVSLKDITCNLILTTQNIHSPGAAKRQSPFFMRSESLQYRKHPIRDIYRISPGCFIYPSILFLYKETVF